MNYQSPFEILETIQRALEADPSQNAALLSDESGLVFHLGEYLCITPLKPIVEIMRLDMALTHLPFVPSWIKGLIPRGSDIVLVVDLMKLLLGQSLPKVHQKRMMVYRFEESWVGFLVPKIVGLKSMGQRVPWTQADLPKVDEAIEESDTLFPIIDMEHQMIGAFQFLSRIDALRGPI